MDLKKKKTTQTPQLYRQIVKTTKKGVTLSPAQLIPEPHIAGGWENIWKKYHPMLYLFIFFLEHPLLA